MHNLMRWLPPVSTHEIFVIPSWAAHRGVKRLRAAAEVVGAEEAKKIARKQGAYELSDELAHDLRLQGLELNAKGEIPVLSPANWLRSSALELRTIPGWKNYLAAKGISIEGLLIPQKARDQLLGFLKAQGRTEFASVTDLIEVADHFLLKDSLQLLVRRATV